MLKDKKSYLIICLAIISMSIFAVNTYAEVSLTRITGYLKIFAGLLFLSSCLILLVYVIKRNFKTYRISLYTLSLFLILNVVLAIEVVAIEYHKHEMAKIEQMNSCEKAQRQFKHDVKSKSLKYFLFGIGFDEELSQNLEDKYNLKVYHIGCIVTSSYECYNELVEQHLNIVELKNSR